MAWTCSHCREDTDDSFDVCWACGARRDGTIDPEFRHADEYEPPIPDEKPQFALGSLFRLVTALCLAAAFLGSRAAGWPDNLTVPYVLTAILGIGAIGYIGLHVVGWVITRWVYGCQQRIREEQGEGLPREDT